MNYSIGITTYSYRYDKFLIKLINNIRSFRNNEIILGINGNYKEEFQEKYRKEILRFCSNYKKIFPFVYPNFRSLSKIWNNIAINSSNEYVLILNDDITISNRSFFDAIELTLEKYKTSFEVNGSFCCFVIKKSELLEVGWFDERFLGIGWEDEDFRKRYFNVFKKIFLNVEIKTGYISHVDWENIIVNQKKGGGKYSGFNQEFFNIKKENCLQYPYEKFYNQNKDKL